MRSAADADVPRLAVTLGDPRGIGPEVVAGALPRFAHRAHLILVGPAGTVADGVDAERVETGTFAGAEDSRAAGRLAADAIVAATRMALSGSVDGIVTAPIDKSALNAAGFHFPGHTEMLSHLAGDPPVAMMMAAERTALGGPLRVVLATTHLPLAQVTERLTTDLLVEQTMLTHEALRDAWRIAEPRIALCAVNPHASDGGLFGDEEARTVQPAVRRLQERGVAAAGPLPADTVFVRCARGEFDAVIAPYHDVGMAAFKTAAFGSGVNVTLGLPFVRTSPDHGTAIDIAGRGVADAGSMAEAIELAITLAARRTPNIVGA